eukprot:evm.model.scf_35.23 EVM.evm.TU.scf_35.23   scf_35:176788-182212(-)
MSRLRRGLEQGGSVLRSLNNATGVPVSQIQKTDNGNPAVKFVAELNQHVGPVNCIRFSPNGERLASAGDKGELLIWKENAQDESLSKDSKPWKPSTVLRGHLDDIFDIAWSPDSTALASGSLEHVMIVWDVQHAKAKARFDGHKHYIQGVAWDPANQFLVSQSGDRTCRVYGRPPLSNQTDASAAQTAGQWVQERLLYKRPVGGENEARDTFMFHDDTLSSFFRRLAWSPEGSFLVIPAGVYSTQHTAYIYARGKWAAPVGHLMGLPEPFAVVRFCPILYERSLGKENTAACGFVQPYKLVLAAAARHSVVIYSTEESEPICLLGSVHYAEITDLAWSPDGQYLAISSRDGYCSIAVFEEEELGVPILPERIPDEARQWLESLQQLPTAPEKRGVKRCAPQNPESGQVAGRPTDIGECFEPKTILRKGLGSQEMRGDSSELPAKKRATDLASRTNASAAPVQSREIENGGCCDSMAKGSDKKAGHVSKAEEQPSVGEHTAAQVSMGSNGSCVVQSSVPFKTGDIGRRAKKRIMPTPLAGDPCHQRACTNQSGGHPLPTPMLDIAVTADAGGQSSSGGTHVAGYNPRARRRIMPTAIDGEQGNHTGHLATGLQPSCSGRTTAIPIGTLAVGFEARGALEGMSALTKLAAKAGILAESQFPDSLFERSEWCTTEVEDPFASLTAKAAAYSRQADSHHEESGNDGNVQQSPDASNPEPQGFPPRAGACGQPGGDANSKENDKADSEPGGVRRRIVPTAVDVGQERPDVCQATGGNLACRGQTAASPAGAAMASCGRQGELQGLSALTRLASKAGILANSVFPDATLGSGQQHSAAEDPFRSLTRRAAAYGMQADAGQLQNAQNCEPNQESLAEAAQLPVHAATQEALGSLGSCTDGQVPACTQCSKPISL